MNMIKLGEIRQGDAILEQAAITADQGDHLSAQCLDNRYFFEMDSSENIKRPKKGLDKKVHIAGKITLAKDLQLEIGSINLTPATEYFFLTTLK